MRAPGPQTSDWKQDPTSHPLATQACPTGCVMGSAFLCT